MSRERPVERCPECGNVLKMEYVGPQEDPHAHHDHGHGHDGPDHGYAHPYEGEPKTFADFVKPEYFVTRLRPFASHMFLVKANEAPSRLETGIVTFIKS
jgi:hypothetical protein